MLMYLSFKARIKQYNVLNFPSECKWRFPLEFAAMGMSVLASKHTNYFVLIEN